MKTLLITGVHGVLGRAAARQAVASGWRVIGVDQKPAARPLADVECVQADIRNPLLSRLLKAEGVDAIFHGAFRWRIRLRPDIFENNVVGAVKLLEAAAEAGVQRIIMPSSAFVYGAHPLHPPLIPEGAPFRGPSSYGYIRDLRDIETFLKGFRQQHPEMTITVLRFANLLGRGYASPLARHLSLPLVPVVLGANPLISALHVDDGARAVIQALEAGRGGVYNVAAQPPLPLLTIIEQVGRQALPLPESVLHAGLEWAATLSKKQIIRPPLPWDYLRHSWALSTRAIRDAWGFTPAYDAEAVLREFAREQPAAPDILTPLHRAIAAGKNALRAFTSSPS
ncbi:MAG TPA: NAD-dependent epimerase/dehydratase family protein [Caldilineae bacterium]|nr:NAD-dependent epimerase/dehydratase family protein [Caldilineae bacterium]